MNGLILSRHLAVFQPVFVPNVLLYTINYYSPSLQPPSYCSRPRPPQNLRVALFAPTLLSLNRQLLPRHELLPVLLNARGVQRIVLCEVEALTLRALLVVREESRVHHGVCPSLLLVATVAEVAVVAVVVAALCRTA